MQMTAKELSSLLEGRLEGYGGVIISHPAKIEAAQPHEVSFISNPKYEQFGSQTQAGVLIVNEDFKPTAKVKATLIRVKDAYKSFAKVLEMYQRDLLNKSGLEAGCFVSRSARLGQHVYIGTNTYLGDEVVLGDNVKIFPNCYIGDHVHIGSDTIIYPGANIYHDSEIGKHCIIHSGAVIGSDGFGFAPQEDGSFRKIPQIGNVVLEDHVEIGANACVDRATMGSTIIRKGVKLDNLVQVAHNVEIGVNTVIAAQAGVSGSTKLGSNCMIGGQAGFVGHLIIEDGTKVGAQTGINRSILEKNQSLMGTPAFEYRQNLKSYVIFRNLPELQKKLLAMEQKIDALENKKI